MKKLSYLPVILFGLGLIGCSSNPEKTNSNNAAANDQELPMWVLNPVVENGISASDCTPWSGDMGMDKAEVTAMARAALAKQLKIRVKAMDKTYKRKVKTASGVSTGGSFETVSKQVADEYLQGSRVIKIARVTIDNVKNLCAQVAIDPNTTKKLFNAIVSSGDKNLNPQSEAVLYEEFKAYKAQEELDKLTK